MNRPQSVTPPLTKGDGAKVVCTCGNQFSIHQEVTQALCPSCGIHLDWGLRK